MAFGLRGTTIDGRLDAGSRRNLDGTFNRSTVVDMRSVGVKKKRGNVFPSVDAGKELADED
jgi:hypothetical protein